MGRGRASRGRTRGAAHIAKEVVAEALAVEAVAAPKADNVLIIGEARLGR